MITVFVTYAIYTAVSLALTFWVARTLYRNGTHFLVDVFDGDDTMAGAVNHLLVVGFWLINIGYIALTLKVTGDVDAREGFEVLAAKLGGVALVLGAMHMFNLFVLAKMRRNRREANRPVMVAPWMAPAPMPAPNQQ